MPLFLIQKGLPIKQKLNGKKIGEKAPTRRPNLIGVVHLEEINDRVDTNGNEEEGLIAEKTQMEYKNRWDSLME